MGSHRHTRQVSRHVRGTSKGLRLSPGMTFDRWVGVGRQLAHLSRASAWWLGDWLVYGERNYGQRYTTALHVTDLDYQTLRNYACVARRFSLSRRRDSLSFQHHAELASLPEPAQDLWLLRAERGNWTRNELRRQLASSRRAAPTAEVRSVLVRIPVSRDRERRWRQAARAADQDLFGWIASVLDGAARFAPGVQHELPGREAPRALTTGERVFLSS